MKEAYHDFRNKIFSLEDISTELKKAREKGKKIGFVEGIFDVLHLGHIELIEFAKKHCDILVIGVASDAYARSTKGPERPIFNQHIRCQVLAALRDIDFVLSEDNPPAVLEDKSAEEYLHYVTKTLKPDVIISSGTTDRNPDAKGDRAKEIGAEFIVQEDPRPSENASTTNIMALLKKLG